MKALPGLAGENRRIVANILHSCLPDHARVLVFGSRARARCKPYSDLDLALDLGGPVPLSLMAELAEAFSESDLPWKVDIIDLHAITPAFARIVTETGIPLDL